MGKAYQAHRQQSALTIQGRFAIVSGTIASSSTAMNRTSSHESEMQRADGCCEVGIGARGEWTGELSTENPWGE